MSFRTVAFAAVLVAAASAQAFAQATPTVPNPSNPFPENPVATDGTSLVGAMYGRDASVARSAFVAEAPQHAGPSFRRHLINVDLAR